MAMCQINKDTLANLDPANITTIRRMGEKVRVFFVGSDMVEFDWKPYGKALWDQQSGTADKTIQTDAEKP